MSNIPNFDSMNKEELVEFWVKYNRPTRKECIELIGDNRKGYTSIVSSLAAYAINKSCAMGLREEGKIEGAQFYEQICDDIYDEIPEDLRW
jgi:hypothetical protein